MIMRRKSLSKQAKCGAISSSPGQNIGKGEWRTEPGQEVEIVSITNYLVGPLVRRVLAEHVSKAACVHGGIDRHWYRR